MLYPPSAVHRIKTSAMGIPGLQTFLFVLTHVSITDPLCVLHLHQRWIHHWLRPSLHHAGLHHHRNYRNSSSWCHHRSYRCFCHSCRVWRYKGLSSSNAALRTIKHRKLNKFVLKVKLFTYKIILFHVALSSIVS